MAIKFTSDQYQKAKEKVYETSTAKKLKSLEEKSKDQIARQNAFDPNDKRVAQFWQDPNTGEYLRPTYPFKPFIEIKFLSDASADELTYSQNLFRIPYNFVTNFSVSTYPYPKCSLTISDQEFTYIERFALTALALYNETILKRQQGYWQAEGEPFVAPGFAKIRWGWEGVSQPISSDWITMILIGFKYNIRATWLDISLDMIGNSQYFFDITKLGTRTDVVKPVDPNTGAEKDNGTLQEFVIAMLKRFSLQNEVHYYIPEEFNRSMTVSDFKGYTNQFRKSETTLMSFINKALSLQLEDTDTRKAKITTIEITTYRPEDKYFEKYGLVKKWILKPPLEKRTKVARIYEWRNTPTSVIQSLEANIPEGYFLGYASLSFMGFTLDDNGNIAEHVVRFDPSKSEGLVSLSTLNSEVQTQHQKERHITEQGEDPDSVMRLQAAQAKINQNEKGYDDLYAPMNKFLDKYAVKDDNGHIVKDDQGNYILREIETDTIVDAETGETRPKTTGDLREEYAAIDNQVQQSINKRDSENAEVRQRQVEGEKQIEQEWNTYIKNHSEFLPIPLNTQSADGLDLDEKAQRDQWLLERLMININEDMVLTLRLTILGDPFLDGTHVDFNTERVRVIVHRPDGKPSLLTNYYLFVPADVTHNITRAGYTTSMTLMTARDAQEEAMKTSLEQQE